MKRAALHLFLSLLAGVRAAFSATVVVTASEDHSLRRGPTIEGGLHAKQSSNNSTDRVVMIRFDSSDLGPTVTAATFLITANPDTVTQFQGTYDFRVYGVIDGDPQDEAFVEGGYDPSVAGSIYDDSANLVDEAQLVQLGDFTASAGTQVSLSTPALLSFLQADTNDIATLVIDRLTVGNNSTFLDRGQATPPRLQMEVIPEPGSVALMALGGLLAGCRRRRR